MRNRAEEKCEGGKIIRVEAHPIPEHPRPNRVKGRMLVGDAAGYVTSAVAKVFISPRSRVVWLPRLLLRDLQTVRRKLMNLTSESISTNGTKYWAMQGA